jgi:hypothetical protein
MFTSPSVKRRLPYSARADLEWWKNIVTEWNGIHFISPERNMVHIYTDASGTKGTGGVFGNEWFPRRTPRRLHKRHTQVKEMYAALYAILCWGDRLRGKHVVFHIDNEAVFCSLNNLSIRSPDTMRLLCQLLQLACLLDFTFSSIWLSSSDNSVADAASRFSFSRMFSLAPNLQLKPSPRRLRIGGTSATPTCPKPSLSIFGTGSHQARDQPTSSAKSPSSHTLERIVSTTPMGLSSPHPKRQSWDGLSPLPAEFNPEPSNSTSGTSSPCIPTPTFHLRHVQPPSSSGSSGASNGTTASATSSASCPFASRCSGSYSSTSHLQRTLGT